MPAVTYLSDWEVRNWQAVANDKDCDELLQELRKATGENWLISVNERPAFKRAWHRLWNVQTRTIKFYTLYADCHGEWQIISLVTPYGSSIFHSWGERDRECIMNYMLGYLGGLTAARRDKKAA
jgi:hypothetical protein